nr:AzlD domain-containing protein [Roseobacter litoralis]
MAILVVAFVTFFSRIAGPVLMSRVAITDRIERFLDSMAVSVVAALVASLIAQAGLREAAAVAICAVVMLRSQSAIWAIMAGICMAAGWSYFNV